MVKQQLTYSKPGLVRRCSQLPAHGQELLLARDAHDMGFEPLVAGESGVDGVAAGLDRGLRVAMGAADRLGTMPSIIPNLSKS